MNSEWHSSLNLRKAWFKGIEVLEYTHTHTQRERERERERESENASPAQQPA